MSEAEPFAPTYDDYTSEELLELAQANARAAIIATVSFLQENEITLADWAEGIGRVFALGWGMPEPWAANEFLDAILTNLRALGADVLTANLDDEDQATATITSLFGIEDCADLGVDRADALHYLNAIGPIATERELRWSWHDHNDRIDLQTQRAAAGT
jgi:hypothetical protein